MALASLGLSSKSFAQSFHCSRISSSVGASLRFFSLLSSTVSSFWDIRLFMDMDGPPLLLVLRAGLSVAAAGSASFASAIFVSAAAVASGATAGAAAGVGSAGAVVAAGVAASAGIAVGAGAGFVAAGAAASGAALSRKLRRISANSTCSRGLMLDL